MLRMNSPKSLAPQMIQGAVASKKIVAANVLQLFNAESKEIFKVRVNPVLTVGGLKQRVATRYGLRD